jgi:hypothetical protein
MKPRDSPHTGGPDVFRSPNVAREADGKPINNTNELLTTSPLPHSPSSCYELSSNPVSPVPSTFITQPPSQHGRVSYVMNVPYSDSDLTPRSTFTQAPSSGAFQSQTVSSLSSNSVNTSPPTNNIPISRSWVQPAVGDSNEILAIKSHAVSRATGATFIPAQGATAAPTIKITAVEGTTA